MNQTYKQSGKVSILFLPAFLITLLFAITGSAAYTTLVLISPSTIRSLFVCSILIVMLIKYGAKWCIKYGKVRNQIVAGISGFIMIAVFGYVILLIDTVLRMQESESVFLNGGIFQQLSNAVLHPNYLVQTLYELTANGLDVTNRRGVVYFTIGRGIFTTLLGIIVLGFVLYSVHKFRKESLMPFCETSKSWAREVELYFKLPEDEELLLSNILHGDEEILEQLETLDVINVNYLLVRLYVTSGEENFYVSISKMTDDGTVSKEDGELSFDETELVSYLTISRNMGFSLLSREAVQPEEVSVKVTTEQKKKKEFRKILYRCGTCVAIIAFTIGILNKMQTNELIEFFWKGGFFYAVVIFGTGVINLLGSFQKNKVIISEENRYEYDAIKRHLVKEEETPIILKVLYILLIFTAVYFVYFYIVEVGYERLFGI